MVIPYSHLEKWQFYCARLRVKHGSYRESWLQLLSFVGCGHGVCRHGKRNRCYPPVRDGSRKAEMLVKKKESNYMRRYINI